jgi:hypothetical protein
VSCRVARPAFLRLGESIPELLRPRSVLAMTATGEQQDDSLSVSVPATVVTAPPLLYAGPSHLVSIDIDYPLASQRTPR